MFNLATAIRPLFRRRRPDHAAAGRRRRLLRHAHAQRRLPGSDFPAHRRRRQGARPRPDDDGAESHPAAGGGGQHRHRRRRGPLQDASAAAANCPSTSRPAPTCAGPRQLVWNRIGAVRSDLPPDVEFTVEQMTPSVFPIMSVVLTGGDNPAQLRDYAFYQLAPLIKTIPDVYRADVAGGDLREIEVIARPDDLLAARPVRRRPRRPDRPDQRAPAGRPHRGPPLAFQILVNNQANTVRQIEEMVDLTAQGPAAARARRGRRQGAAPGPRPVDRLRPEGRRGHHRLPPPRRQHGQHLARRSRPAGRRRPDAAGRRPAQAAAAQHPGDRRLRSVARSSRPSVDNVRDAILVGGLFSILILLLFLRSWRATLISALAIPTTLAITFLFLYWSGETLNLMSLGGLAVAIGLIIDDTVVVVENIARHLTPGGTASADSRARSEQDPSPPDPGRRSVDAASERDHRRRRRLDADDGAGLRAAGVHRRRLRPVLRRR